MLNALVAGCFSFENGHTTAGDVLACEVVCAWLEEAGFAYDVARVPSIGQGVDWTAMDPAAYSHVIYVCGPFGRGDLESRFLTRFAGCRLIGVDLTMLMPLNEWNPFDLLIERDSSRAVHPDITFLSQRPHVPVVGVCLVEDYPGPAVAVAQANAAIERLLSASTVVRVNIDTRLDENSTGLRTAAEVESLLARMDAVVTTRLHGMVLSLKNGVPVLAIDPEAGGAKVKKQADCIGWPVVFAADALPERALEEALAYCLSEAGRAKAQHCRSGAMQLVEDIRGKLISQLTSGAELDSSRAQRAQQTISVVISCRQQESFIDGAIGSILAQTRAPSETIVVDTCAQDHAGALAAKYPALRVMRQPGASLGAAYNAGWSAASGQYAVFLQADERLLPHALQTGLNRFHLYPESAVVCGAFRDLRADGSAKQRHPACLQTDSYREVLEGGCGGTAAAAMYRRDTLALVSGFGPSSEFCGAYELHLRIARKHAVHSYDEMIAERLLHDGSSSLNAGPALRAALDALGSERPYFEGDTQRTAACRRGVRAARTRARSSLLTHIGANIALGKPLAAATLTLKLMSYLPAWMQSLWFQLRLSAGTRT